MKVTFLVPFMASAFLSLDRSRTADGMRTKAGGLEQVLTTLSDMLKVFNEQAAEDKTNWENYDSWSDKTIKDRNDFIEVQEGIVMTSTAQLGAAQQLEQQLIAQLGQLAQEIAATKTSIKELTDLRTDMEKAFQDNVKDLTDTSQAVTEAMDVLRGHYAAQGAVGLSQVKAQIGRALNMLAMSRVASQILPKYPMLVQVLDEPSKWLSKPGTDYSTYTGVAAESGGVVGVLEKIHSQMMTQKQQAIEEENKSRQEYEEAKKAKEDDLARDEKTQQEKTEDKEANAAKISQLTATISQSKLDIETATKEVKAMEEEHASFLKMYNERTALRTNEQRATQAALDALREVSLTASGLGVFMQFSSSYTFRLKSAVKSLMTAGQKARNGAMIRAALTLQQKMREPQAFFKADAMEPVKELLRKLITRLEEEQAQETSHHEWCQSEKKLSNEAKAKREKNIEDLTAEIAQLNTRITELTEDITFLASELVRVQQETEEATRIRADENAVFVKAKQDHDDVIRALNAAIGHLSGMYTSSFLQVKAAHKQSPGMPFSEYKSGNAGGGDALSMLQDLLNKYNTARTELIAAEEAALKAFEELKAKNEAFRITTTQDKQAKEAEKRMKSERLVAAKGELADNQKELEQVTQYLLDLRPACDDIRMTFEERKEHREEEIRALNECLDVLSDPSMLR